jgi:hypothetical protein
VTEILFPVFGEGTCINCGYLFQVSTTQLGEHEFTAKQRAYGYLPTQNRLLCFRHAADLIEELKAAELLVSQEVDWKPEEPGDSRRHTAVRRVTRKARDCDRFYAWVEHFGPKWHYEDWRMRDLEEMRSASRMDIAQMQKRSNEALAEIMKDHKEITEALKAVVEEANNDTNRWQLAFFAMTLVALLLAVGALAYPNGASWLDWVPGQRSSDSQPAPTP